MRAEITQLKGALTAAEQGRAAAEKEKDAATGKLNEATTEIAGITKERDQLIADLKNAKDAQQRVEVLVTENSDLQKKLAEAEKTVREISDDKPKKEQEIADVRRQVEQLRSNSRTASSRITNLR